MLALAKNSNKTEDEIMKRLPLARAYQQLMALARQNGMRVVWPDTYQTPEEKFDVLRPLLKELLARQFGGHNAAAAHHH